MGETFEPMTCRSTFGDLVCDQLAGHTSDHRCRTESGHTVARWRNAPNIGTSGAEQLDTVEEVAWLGGHGLGGRYLVAECDENGARFTVVTYAADGVTVTAVAECGRYAWVSLAEWFCDGLRDGAVVPAVVADNAGEWVRNRIIDMAQGR